MVFRGTKESRVSATSFTMPRIQSKITYIWRNRKTWPIVKKEENQWGLALRLPRCWNEQIRTLKQLLYSQGCEEKWLPNEWTNKTPQQRGRNYKNEPMEILKLKNTVFEIKLMRGLLPCYTQVVLHPQTMLCFSWGFLAKIPPSI